MPKMKVLSGKDVVRFLERHGFLVVSQKGSHIRMISRSDQRKVTVVVPNHKVLKRGMQHQIMKESLRSISAAEVFEFFYTE
jgi:predicted RNA binding protein YcfA (HicA-like mRNA interferase family)